MTRIHFEHPKDLKSLVAIGKRTSFRCGAMWGPWGMVGSVEISGDQWSREIYSFRWCNFDANWQSFRRDAMFSSRMHMPYDLWAYNELRRVKTYMFYHIITEELEEIGQWDSLGTNPQCPLEEILREGLRVSRVGCWPQISIRVSIRANSSLMRMIHKKKIGSLHIGSLMYVYPNKTPRRLVPATRPRFQGSGKNSATARASGERATVTPSATPLFSPELLGASPEVKSQLAQAHRVEDLESWNMLEPSAGKILSIAQTHTQTPTRTQTQTQKHTHTHTLIMYIYI